MRYLRWQSCCPSWAINPRLSPCREATPGRSPHAGKFTLSRQETEPFAGMLAREKLEGKVTARRGLLSPDFIASAMAVEGAASPASSAGRGQRGRRDGAAKGHGQQCCSVRRQQKTHCFVKRILVGLYNQDGSTFFYLLLSGDRPCMQNSLKEFFRKHSREVRKW